MKNFFNLKTLAIAFVSFFIISFTTTSCSSDKAEVKTSTVVDFEKFLGQGFTCYSMALANGDTIAARVSDNICLAFIGKNCEISYIKGSRTNSKIISLKKAPE